MPSVQPAPREVSALALLAPPGYSSNPRMPTPTHIRPLRVRKGARFTCAGDGLCCTDVHAIGPLSRKEVNTLRCIVPEVALYMPEVRAHVLETRRDGGCIFLGEGRCELHAALGPQGKPKSCRRFPFGLVATPSGGRITTDHRCPCRTMGNRPAIDPEEAAQTIRGERKTLRADRSVVTTIPLEKRRRVSFARYEAIEAALLDRLLDLEDPLDVLEAKPFPELAWSSWTQIAYEMLECGSHNEATVGQKSRFETAFVWFGSAILHHTEGFRSPRLPRPWSDAFDRAEARTETAERPKAILADFLADEIWNLKWIDSGSFAHCRTELATRVAVGSILEKRLRRAGARPDRAAAETVTILDLVGTSDFWAEVVRRMVLA